MGIQSRQDFAGYYYVVCRILTNGKANFEAGKQKKRSYEDTLALPLFTLWTPTMKLAPLFGSKGAQVNHNMGLAQISERTHWLCITGAKS